MSQPQLHHYDLVVIGAGMSGLQSARHALKCGIRTLVLDKGSRVGGRMATRPLNQFLADYGLQYIELHSEQARDHLRAWKLEGIVKPWSYGFGGESPGRSVPKHFVVGGMNRLPANLAAGLDVRLRTEVQSVGRNRSEWVVETREGGRYTCKGLVLSCPAPQAERLLVNVADRLDQAALKRLRAIRYDPCFSLIAELTGPSAIPCPGGLLLEGEPVAWIGDNHQKGISGSGHLVTVHASARFTEQYFNMEPAKVAGLLLESARPHIGVPVASWHLHRWKYARPRASISEPFLAMTEDSTLVVCGDAFGGAGLESALLSGVETGRLMASVSTNAKP